MRHSSGRIARGSMSGILWVLPSRIGVDAVDGEGRGTGEGSSKVGDGAVLRGLGRTLLLVGCGYGNGGGDDEDGGGSGSLEGRSGHDDDGGGAPVASVATVAGATHTDKAVAVVAVVGQDTAAVAVGYTPIALASSPPLHSQHLLRPCS